MTDLNNALGLNIDTTPIANLRDRLNETKQAGSNAAAGLKDAGGAIEQMQRQMAGMLAQQQQLNNLLQNGTIHTTSYTDSLLKLATAGAAAAVAYKGMAEGISLVSRGMHDQVAIAEKLHTLFSGLASYGKNYFSLMSDQAVAAQRAITAVGQAAGSTGAQFATFTQRMSTTGASSSTVQSAFGGISTRLNDPYSDAGSLARRSLSTLGVATAGSPDEVAAQALGALRNVRVGSERNQLADDVFGPGGADLLKDTIAGIGKVTEQERQLNILREDNATAERQAAEARREADEAAVAFYEQHPIKAFFASGANPNAATANDRNSALFGQNWTSVKEEALGRKPGFGVFSDLFSSIGQRLGIGNGPQFPSTHALDYGAAAPTTPQEYAKGLTDLAAAGDHAGERISNLVNIERHLADDRQKGAITAGDYAAALKAVDESMTKAVDPLHEILLNAQNATSLRAFAPGQSRGSEEERRRYATSYFNAHPSQARDANGNMVGPEGYSALHAPGEDQAVQAYVRTNVVNPLLDAVREAQQKAGVANAGANAAIGGSDAAHLAEMRAQAAGQRQKNPGGAAQIDQQLAAEIADYNASNRKSTNIATYNALNAANSGMDTAHAALAGRGIAPSDNSPSSLADVLKKFADGLPAITTIDKHIEALLTTERQQQNAIRTGKGVAAGQEVGITESLSGLSAQKSVFEGMLKLPGLTDDMTATIKRGMTTIDEETAKLTGDYAALEHQKQVTADLTLQRDYMRQFNPINAKIGALQSGTGTDAAAVQAQASRYMDQSAAAGGSLTLSQATTMAAALVKADSTYKDMTASADDFNKATTSGMDAIVNGLDSVITGTKSWKDALRGVVETISQIGVDMFVKQPLNSFMQNGLNGNGWTPGPSGASGLLSMLGSLFGGGSSVAAASGAIGNDAALADPGSFGAASASTGAFSAWAYHGGGVVGMGAPFSRSIDPRVFIGAPRMHSGGMLLGSDEVPIIAQRGERIVSRDQAGAAGGNTTHVHNWHINANDPAAFRGTERQIASNMNRTMAKATR